MEEVQDVERKINAPDGDFLTEAQAAAWLNLDTDDFRTFVGMGILPRGMPWGKKPGINHRWHWMDMIAVGHLISRGHIKLPGEEEKPTNGGR